MPLSFIQKLAMTPIEIRDYERTEKLQAGADQALQGAVKQRLSRDQDQLSLSNLEGIQLGTPEAGTAPRPPAPTGSEFAGLPDLGAGAGPVQPPIQGPLMQGQTQQDLQGPPEPLSSQLSPEQLQAQDQSLEALRASAGRSDQDIFGQAGLDQYSQVPEVQDFIQSNAARSANLPEGMEEKYPGYAMAFEQAKSLGDIKLMQGLLSSIAKTEATLARDEIQNQAALGRTELMAEAQRAQFERSSEDKREKRPVPASTAIATGGSIGAISQLDKMISSVGDLDLQFGPSDILRGFNPWDTTAKGAKQLAFATKQIIGKGLEGGVLRKEDEHKYDKIIPRLGDTRGVLQAKYSQLREMLQLKYEYDVKILQAAGFDVSNFPGVQSTSIDISTKGDGAIQETTVQTGAPQAGAVEDGYRFKGGDPKDPNNWEKL